MSNPITGTTRPTDEQLMQALEMIRDTCAYFEAHGIDCEECPFCLGDLGERCKFIHGKSAPVEWELEPIPSAWRAFHS